MKAPAKCFKLLLSQPVAVACRWRGVVRRAVALDRQHKLTGPLRMPGGEIETIAGRPPLRHKRHIARGERVVHIGFERIERYRNAAVGGKAAPAAGSIFEIAAQQLDAACLRARRVHIQVSERRDQRQPPASAGDRNVEPPLAALGQQRAEAIRQLAAAIFAVADAQDYRVALIALHALEILDKERLFAIEREKRLMIGSPVQRLIQRRLDALRVRNAHRDNAERFPRPAGNMLKNELDNADDLGRRGFVAAIKLGAPRHQHMRNRVAGAGAGERDQPVVIDMPVRERDQRLVAAAIVPVERP